MSTATIPILQSLLNTYVPCSGAILQPRTGVPIAYHHAGGTQGCSTTRVT